MSKDCQIDHLLPWLYVEHWKPLRWKMRSLVCSRNFSDQTWANEKICSDLEVIGYGPIRHALKEIWEGFKVDAKELNNESHGFRWYKAQDVRDPSPPIGRVMSEEEKKRASTWMFLQEGPPENVLWQDAVMAVWKEHVVRMMI